MNRDGKLVSIAAGSVILADALAARLTLTADEGGVYFVGHAILWQCSMRRIGLPCPTCGMTRSMVMALHGEFARAWNMAPGAPMFVAGVLLLAAALLFSAMRRTPVPRWMQAGGVVYAAAAAVSWLSGWAIQFAAAWRAR